MEVVISILQPRQTNDTPLASQQKPHSSVTSNSTLDYDILLIDEPSSTNRTSKRLQLPHFRVEAGDDPGETAYKVARRLLRRNPTAVIPIPLWSNVPSSSSTSSRSVSNSEPTSIARFKNFGTLLQQCSTDSDCVDTETKHWLLKLEEWLINGCRKDSQFIRRAFLRSPALKRIRACVHNPAYEPEQSMQCYKVLGNKKDVGGMQSCDLAEETSRSNVVRAIMMSMEKYDMFIMNPLFGSGLEYDSKANAPTYYAKGRSELQGNGKLNSNKSWSERYPLHKAAYDDNAEEVKRLLMKGMNANELDNASWTPLHYCAFYNNLNSMEVLLVYSNTDVNVRNKAGSTPLHFAALQAHAHMVELLLTHSLINVEAKDSRGQRPIDVCACVPKKDHQLVAELLRNWNRLEKIQVELMDGGNAQLSLVQGDGTTAGQLHESMCRELKLNSDSSALFAIWICSDALSVQLKEHHKPLSHMKHWGCKVAKFGNDSSYKIEEEIPKLFFRRDARISLSVEKKAKLTPDALSLLYSEAQKNFMKGLYPCAEKDMINLAAITFRIIHGNNCTVSCDKLQTLIPHHRIPTTKSSIAEMCHEITKQYRSLEKWNLVALQNEFLHICWRLCVYGAIFFDGIVFMRKPRKVTIPAHVGVNDYGIHLINASTKSLLKTYPLNTFRFEVQANKECIDLHADAVGHSFIIKTSQAVNISNLLKRLIEGMR
uniref:FERM domain-containing protein n=1 Tax=Syphacia muris TaxID=451379 RepID=A0A0N5AJF2_9BILA